MYDMILNYFSNRRILLLSFIVIPFIFIAIGNPNLLFLSFITFSTSFVFIFDNFTYSIALPISRKDIVKGNYLGYLILVITHIGYILALLYLAKRYFHLKTDGSFSILGVLYSIDILAIFSLYIPLAIRNKAQLNRWIGLFPAVGYSFILIISFYSDYLEGISIFYHLILTVVVVLFFFFLGFRDSVKNIERIDF
jgi:hypothetical protein